MYWSCANCTGTSKKYKSTLFIWKIIWFQECGKSKRKHEKIQHNTDSYHNKRRRREYEAVGILIIGQSKEQKCEISRKRSVESNLRSCFLELFWCWFCVERSSLEGVKLCKSSLKGLNLLRNLQTHKRLLCVFFVYLSNTYWY